MKIVYFDCFSGASGDMVLGALIDAGVPLEEVRRALGSLAISADTVWTERVLRAGVAATKFCVRGEDVPGSHAHASAEHAHAHAHAHAGGGESGGAHVHLHEHAHAAPSANTAPVSAGHGGVGHVHTHAHSHRTLDEIVQAIDRSGLSPAGKDRARQLFARLGAVEAEIHDTAPEAVHLHEVGALDSIIDIVGAVFALESLGADRIVSSPLNVGSGTIRSAHGLYPVPAPATMRLLEGAPIYAGPQAAELVTPTGALLLTHFASAFGPLPAMRVRRIGYGAGSRDFPGLPNVLRVLIGEDDGAASIQTVVVIEAEIDDMNPQIFGVLIDRLLGEGALDVFYTPIQMKKNRPGTLLTVLAAPEARERLTATIFRETTTIGIRYREMIRECLDRETVVVDTAVGRVRMKVARRGGELMNASPEFDDCVRLAAASGRPVKEVQALASSAFFASQS